jgi:uncharacterized cupin superfamily protein
MNERATALAQRLIRNMASVPQERFERAPLYESLCGPLSEGTAARKLGASIDLLPPGKRGCPYHLHHAQEEMFIILEGEGSLRVAGEMLPLRTGDVVFIPPGPDYPHQIINTSAAPLKYLSISTQDLPEICEYPDSGKFLAKHDCEPSPALDDEARKLRFLGRRDDSLDYWDGEP